jgi:hypothetical protein
VEKPHRPSSPRNDDRRAHARYPFILPLRYTVLQRREPLKTGDGRTVDVSSSGVRFIADGAMQPGDKMEVAMDWPLMLNGDMPLRLIALGTVVWTEGNHVGLQATVQLGLPVKQGSDGLTAAIAGNRC